MDESGCAIEPAYRKVEYKRKRDAYMTDKRKSLSAVVVTGAVFIVLLMVIGTI